MSNMWFSFSWKYKRSPTYLKMLQQSEYLEKPNRGKYKKTLQTLTVCSCHVTYEFQSESTLYSCLNVKELLVRSKREIWRWSDCNWNRAQNHVVVKRTFNHLAKLTKWWGCVLSTFQYSALDCMLLSCNVRLS